MKVKYLTHKQAIAACLRHQYLVGSPFQKDDPRAGVVSHVVLAPYSPILQWHFLSAVFSGAPHDDAIAICRDGKYDVLILSSKYNPAKVRYPPKRLRSYLEEFDPQLPTSQISRHSNLK